MGDRPKKIATQLLIFAKTAFFLFYGILYILHCKCTFIYYRQQDAVFIRVQCFFLQRDPDYAINIIPASNCQI